MIELSLAVCKTIYYGELKRSLSVLSGGSGSRILKEGCCVEKLGYGRFQCAYIDGVVINR
jgi:hypothetical protein